MVTEGPPVKDTLSITSGYRRALRQEIRAADLLGLRVEHVDEQTADGLALHFGIGDAFELAEERLRCIHMHQRDVVVVAEQVDDGLGLVLAQHAVIDEYASELIADRLVDQHSGHGRVDAAGETADHLALADLRADLLDGFLAERAHGPVAGEAGDVAHEVADQLRAVGRMRHFGVELHRVEFSGRRRR